MFILHTRYSNILQYMKLGVLVNAFARTTELYACLSSVLEATKVLTDARLVIHQSGIDDSMAVSDQFRNDFDVRYVKPASANALKCINTNRILGLEILFSEMKVDAVLAVEDDIEISKDSGNFCQFIFDRYYADDNFRGINLGSRIPRSNIARQLNTYSLLRYGLHGQAGLIPKRTWQYIRKKGLGLEPLSGFDAQIEAYLKTGFMVTPNFSRYLDRGFDLFATHATRDSTSRSITTIEESYVGRFYYPDNPQYELSQSNHMSWRSDAITYKASENLNYWLKYKIKKVFGSVRH